MTREETIGELAKIYSEKPNPAISVAIDAITRLERIEVWVNLGDVSDKALDRIKEIVGGRG